MSALRLYEVEVTVRVMVLAESADAAEHFVERDADNCVSDALMESRSEVWAREPTTLDAETGASLPFHDEEDVPDRTCAQWLADIQAADAEAKRVAAFCARQVSLPGVR